MSAAAPDLEARVAALAASLDEVRARVDRLEAARVAPRAGAARLGPRGHAPAVAAAHARTEVAALSRVVALTGRTLLVLAGAFLLRALTDAGALPAWAGVLAGFAYAGAWVAAADRSAARDPWGAAFHGGAAVVVGFPLLYEATSRFALLPHALAVALLAGFTAVALLVAARRALPTVAWLAGLGGAVTALALAAAAGRLGLSALYLVLLGTATLWLGYVRDWFGLRWPIAVAADAAVALLAFRALAPGAAEGPATALGVALAAMALYLGSVAARTLLLGRAVVPFEVVQTIAVVAVGLGGAAWVAAGTGTGAGAVGLAGAAFGLSAYAVAFAFVLRRQGRRENFRFYASLGLVFVLVGSALALPRGLVPAAWALLAVGSSVAARRVPGATLHAHAAAYAACAAVASGLVLDAARAIAGVQGVLAPAEPAAAIVAVALAAAAWLDAGGEAARAPLAARLPRLLLVAAAAVAATGLLAATLVPLVASGAGADPGWAATTRTAIFAAGGVTLAALGRSPGWREAGALAYPVLVAVGVKLLLEDIPRSRPATLFLAFGLYGAALLLVPRLRRRLPAEAAG